uniref:NAD(P)-binding domain-containing protein n=1 Tax=Octactis speculum TaxID=3111310 RepID=A0A7S2GI21_9STRA|mmetsp:Transcript_46536/g.63376  ORF Transcript_46536/g.63376 Transcript_46536/m.63376 type:complete len:297 (+) Transcript_46536:26-916(+)|eukprot:CAMPEP_0185771668 /NCGR_PEP_ID=MMETSP1174-20130828/64544_1 /TAXON_ID=35687 /ORGANISM="Dictyocha speculum, Strain CCMP1381" /LENGTH=296 /DNA_ID=CAMNT_0028457589 /DNA_START=25 /DNA_END=915 /DNA_ORIENTATION=+
MRYGRVTRALLLFVSIIMGNSLSMSATRKVVVTGAGGQTGSRVFKKLLARSIFEPVGLVRTEESKSLLVGDGFPEEKIIVGDVCDQPFMQSAMQGCDAVVICTSAKPVPTKTMTPEGRPVFDYPNGQPEAVDWVGQKNQIDAALASGTVSHVVICSSMGGTDPNNMLNSIGRSGGDGTPVEGGNILLWKRKAEKYLIDSGLTYTIVHPGGLVNEPGGERELVPGVDDSQQGTDNRSIPRDDVARVLVNSLIFGSYENRSFDVRSKPVGEGKATTDFDALLKGLDGKNCDYTLGEIP